MKLCIGCFIFPVILFGSTGTGCDPGNNGDHDLGTPRVFYDMDRFCMGADLSYVNQIEDHGGIYSDSGLIKDPYHIFKSHGTNLVRLRLWHHPSWTGDLYGSQTTGDYNDLRDTEKSIRRAREAGMGVLLDFHYSDSWADPGKQVPPEAWKDISSLDVLEDSVYRYTRNVMQYLNLKGLMPEMVQIGNEINCGLLMTGTDAGFPDLNACNDKWIDLGRIINAGIRAVREVSEDSAIKTRIVLHVAGPENVVWWFDNMISGGMVIDFDIIGFSYYPLWHTAVSYYDLTSKVTEIVGKYGKKVMILETAYPWSLENADNYQNLFGSQSPVAGYDFSINGQSDFLINFTQKMISAGLSGVIYWEPAWITSEMKDQWGTGSAWENAALFDFEGNALTSINYMNYPYVFP